MGDAASLTWSAKQHFLFGSVIERVQRGNLFLFGLNGPTSHVDPYGQFVDPSGNLSSALEAFWDLSIGCGLRIKDEVWKAYGENRGGNDPSARLAHCIAHCRISRECFGGPATSWLGGLAKEIEDAVTKLVMGKGEGYDQGDMAANALGRKFAKCTNKSCEEQCQGALNDGSLYRTTAPTIPR